MPSPASVELPHPRPVLMQRGRVALPCVATVIAGPAGGLNVSWVVAASIRPGGQMLCRSHEVAHSPRPYAESRCELLRVVKPHQGGTVGAASALVFERASTRSLEVCHGWLSGGCREPPDFERRSDGNPTARSRSGSTAAQDASNLPPMGGQVITVLKMANGVSSEGVVTRQQPKGLPNETDARRCER